MMSRLIPARAILVAALCVLLCSSIAANAYTPLDATQLKAVMPSTTRYVMSLAGDWERSIDGNEWTVAKLPMSESYSGKITYKRTLQIDPALVGRYMWNLYFLGLSDAVELTVNNQYVGRSFGGMVPFMVRIPDKYIKAGKNDIQLEISPASDEAVRMRKLDLFGQRSYTGVVREILLVGTPQAMVGDIRTSVKFTNGDAQVNIISNIVTGALDRLSSAADSSGRAIELTTSQLSIDAELRFDETGTVVATGSQSLAVARDRSTDANFSFRVTNPALWSPLSPQLYTLTISIKANGITIDEMNAQIGMVSVQDGNLSSQSLLSMNGSPLFVKAVDYVEDAPGGGATITADGLERDVQLMKTLGVNAIRTRFFAPHPY
ncbi:MAG: hypothetical protein JNL32_14620, partial [Candidatus Kapabacteria bacterium]|nr:hypothetical protein [Candidatus Kapabacteria bacterium]